MMCALRLTYEFREAFPGKRGYVRLTHRLAIAAMIVAFGAARSAAGGRAGWTSGGPEGGSVAAFAVSPSSPNVVYAAMNGLVFQSTNSGEAWKVVSAGLPVAQFGGSDLLAVDAASATTIYASPGHDLFKSTDGGASWAVLAIPPSPGIFAIAADPRISGTIYIATAQEGLFKSTDGGLTWSPKNSGLIGQTSGLVALTVNTVSISPSDSSVIYVSLPAGIFVSRDAGEHWVQGNFLFSYARITVEPTDPATAIATGSDFSGVYRTRDFGVTWSPFDVAGNESVSSILFDAGGSSALFAAVYSLNGAPALLRSADLGATWNEIAAGPPGETIDALAFPGSTMLAGFFASGVFRSTDSGLSWRSSNEGLIAVFMSSVAVRASGATPVYAGASDGRLFRSDDSGRSWNPTALKSFSVNFVTIDPQDPQVVYASVAAPPGSFESVTRGVVLRTSDGGASWVQLLAGGEPFGFVAVDPLVPSTLYAGSDAFHNHGLQKSVDGGGTWSEIDTGFGTSAFAIDPASRSRLYAAGGDGVFRSDDAGATWLPLGAVGGYPLHVVVGSDPGSTVLASVSDGAKTHVLRSTDRGEHWLSTQGLPAAVNIVVAPDPRAVTTFYAGTSVGEIYVSRDTGATWARLNGGGLPNAGVSALAVLSNGLAAATAGGVFEIDLISISRTSHPIAAPVKKARP